MILLDIGNSFIKVYKNGQIEIRDLNDFPKEPFYYINVNQKIEIPKNGIDVSKFFNFKTNYKNLGIDRIAACYSIKEGVVLDAGSAITIDIMEENFHKGGLILPGLRAYQKSFATISPILDKKIDPIPLNDLPNDTKKAMSFAVFGSIVSLVERIRDNKKIFLTGGDGEIFLRYFENAIYDKTLVFKGIIKAIKERDANNSPA